MNAIETNPEEALCKPLHNGRPANAPVDTPLSNALPISEQPKPSASKIVIRKDLRFVPQRGKIWRCVVEDPQNKKFYRIGRREYLIASALDGHRDLSKTAAQLNKAYPELNIEPSTLEGCVKWLLQAGLAQIVDPSKKPSKDYETTNEDLNSSEKSDADTKKDPLKGAKNFAIDPFSFRVPIFGSEQLAKVAWTIRFLASTPGLVAGACLIVAAAIAFFANRDFFVQLGAKLFVPEGTIWWASAWFVLKIVHELGHATFCIANGATIRGAGVSFFYLAPVPYVDTTDMWRLPSRRARAFCAAGGMWFELLLASLALFAIRCFDSPSIQYFLIAITTLGTFTTIAFNANPLIRFDGYYLFSDAIDRPTLWADGQNAWKSLFKGNALRLTPAIVLHGVPLVLYGAGCFFNRWLMMIGMAWTTWHTWRGVGLVLIGVAAFLWFGRPYLRRQKSLLTAGKKAFQLPSLTKCVRFAAVALGMSTLALLLPSPWQPQVPGIITYSEPITLRPVSEGVLVEVLVSDDAWVEAGEVIARFENPVLELQRTTLALQRDASIEKTLVLRAQGKLAEGQAEQARADSIAKELLQVEAKVAALTIKSPSKGRWISRQLENQLGRFFRIGDPIGMVATSNILELSCSVSQEDIERFRNHIGGSATIFSHRFGWQSGLVRKVEPRAADTLESPVLAAKYGGPITVHLVTDTKDGENPIKTEKPRFVAKVSLSPEIASSFRAGQVCRVQLDENAISIADAIDRGYRSFVDWIRPAQVK